MFLQNLNIHSNVLHFQLFEKCKMCKKPSSLYAFYIFEFFSEVNRPTISIRTSRMKLQNTLFVHLFCILLLSFLLWRQLITFSFDKWTNKSTVKEMFIKINTWRPIINSQLSYTFFFYSFISYIFPFTSYVLASCIFLMSLKLLLLLWQIIIFYLFLPSFLVLSVGSSFKLWSIPIFCLLSLFRYFCICILKLKEALA